MKKKKFHEDNRRSIIKAITFRLLVLCSDFIVIFLITHRTDITFGLVIFSNLASTTIYYLHERIWNTVHWGRRSK